METTKYPNLKAFLSGWFHQDFDIVGDTIDDVVAGYRRVSPQAEARLVAAETRALISDFGDDLDEAFRQQFDLDIEPTAFAATVRDFLLRIVDRLESE